MKKESPVGLFFGILLKGVVIILGIAIAVLGILILLKVVKSDHNKIEPATTVGDSILTEADAKDNQIYETTEATTALPQATEGEEYSYHKNILVLNSTSTQGLAGRWCGKLNDAGYVNTFASDYSTLQETTRIIAKQEGVGTDLAAFFNGATYEVGDVTEGTSTSTANYDIIIILGTSDIDQ